MVIILKTFYVFKLNKNYSVVAKNHPENIYILLNSIYTYKDGDIIVAFDLFNEICISINKDFFNIYFYNKLKNNDEYTKFKNIHMYNNYLTGEVSKMEVNISHIKIKSNIDENIFILNMLDNLFICNFKNSKYKYFTNKDRINSKMML